MPNQFITYDEDILEIEKGHHYAVPSLTENSIYRNVTTVFTEETIELQCDCQSGYYRNVRRMCRHKKRVMPIIILLGKQDFYRANR